MDEEPIRVVDVSGEGGLEAGLDILAGVVAGVVIAVAWLIAVVVLGLAGLAVVVWRFVKRVLHV